MSESSYSPFSKGGRGDFEIDFVESRSGAPAETEASVQKRIPLPGPGSDATRLGSSAESAEMRYCFGAAWTG